MRILLAISLLTAAACGADTAAGDDAVVPDATSDGYATLIHGAWTLPPASENFVCVRQTVTRDTYIEALRPIAPSGTHHAVLSLGPPDGPDGVTSCDRGQPRNMIFGAGVGAEALELPPGIAVHARPGQQLMLNLHLFNASDTTMTGDSGVAIRETTAAEVQHEAGVALAGKTIGLEVVPGASTQTGVCTTPAGGTIFAVGPHMHRLGSHLTVTYETAAGTDRRTLFDQPYSFDSQVFKLLADPIPTTAGGKLTIQCSYVNPSGVTVGYGESTTNEMCFAGLFVYPLPPATQCVQ